MHVSYIIINCALHKSFWVNKLASLEATLVRNSAHSLTHWLTGVRCRATSVAKKVNQFTLFCERFTQLAWLLHDRRSRQISTLSGVGCDKYPAPHHQQLVRISKLQLWLWVELVAINTQPSSSAACENVNRLQKEPTSP